MIANDNLPPLAARAFCALKAQLRLRGETNACAIFEATRAALDMPEDECGAEIHGAIFLAVRQGTVSCNTYDVEENSLVFGRQTTLAPIDAARH